MAENSFRARCFRACLQQHVDRKRPRQGHHYLRQAGYRVQIAGCRKVEVQPRDRLHAVEPERTQIVAQMVDTHLIPAPAAPGKTSAVKVAHGAAVSGCAVVKMNPLSAMGGRAERQHGRVVARRCWCAQGHCDGVAERTYTPAQWGGHHASQFGVGVLRRRLRLGRVPVHLRPARPPTGPALRYLRTSGGSSNLASGRNSQTFRAPPRRACPALSAGRRRGEAYSRLPAGVAPSRHRPYGQWPATIPAQLTHAWSANASPNSIAQSGRLIPGYPFNLAVFRRNCAATQERRRWNTTRMYGEHFLTLLGIIGLPGLAWPGLA